ncbi:MULTISPECIES: DsbA family protein [Kurthia]|uniref:DsbA family protein n=1 Tax=Kurthia TaxID=1649 RepID=UPI000745B663|nr:DsbA family protein [Kurthia sp. 11kri321]AMA63725.1 thioredoxin family protein [Kurthia sp. 11kri321]
MTHLQLVTDPVSPPASYSKPIELYVFIDLLQPKSRDLHAIIRKLQVNYGHYFSIRFILSTELSSLNVACHRINNCASHEELVDLSHPVLPSIAVKAAELQGKKVGHRFLMKLFEYQITEEKNIRSCNTLTEIAKAVSLDVEEFEADFRSLEAARSFQSDLCITHEMDVQEVPSFVFFNGNIEDEGLKVSGTYSYEIYEQILSELLEKELVQAPPPPLEELFKKFHVLSAEEVASFYNISEKAADRELKKRLLQQKIERIHCKHHSLFRLKTAY